MPGCDSAGAAAERSFPMPDVRGGAERNYPTLEVSGPAQEELPHCQEAAAAQAQEGREELLHVQGQEGRP